MGADINNGPDFDNIPKVDKENADLKLEDKTFEPLQIKMTTEDLQTLELEDNITTSMDSCDVTTSEGQEMFNELTKLGTLVDGISDLSQRVLAKFLKNDGFITLADVKAMQEYLAQGDQQTGSESPYTEESFNQILTEYNNIDGTGTEYEGTGTENETGTETENEGDAGTEPELETIPRESEGGFRNVGWDGPQQQNEWNGDETDHETGYEGTGSE